MNRTIISNTVAFVGAVALFPILLTIGIALCTAEWVKSGRFR